MTPNFAASAWPLRARKIISDYFTGSKILFRRRGSAAPRLNRRSGSRALKIITYNFKSPYVELSMVIENQLGPEGMRQTEAFFHRAGVVIEPVTLDQGVLARQAFLDFGKGRHKASLNYGDCFSYALAKATGEPLLFKGNDFRRTDIRVAAPII